MEAAFPEGLAVGPPALPPPPAPRLRCVLTKAQQEDLEAGRPRDSVS